MPERILLIICGGVAAYKCHELIRLFKKAGVAVDVILTKAGKQFVTPLSLSALSGEKIHEDLFDLTLEHEMGHIALARRADKVIVAPATADFMAKMAHGLADDLASTCLLVTHAPIYVAPAMNPSMLEHPAIQENLNKLTSRGVTVIPPESGDMACGEHGLGRMADPQNIFDVMVGDLPLKGKKALVTSGPTWEAIDPVRVIANRSSGKQGYTIAHALRAKGADVTYVTGPTVLPAPIGCKTIEVETAEEMLSASLQTLPVDIAIFAAAVADWKVTQSIQKYKKQDGNPNFEFIENPDILKTVANHEQRPSLVVGFAAETENILEYGRKKLATKKCDWIIANDVKTALGSDENKVTIITQDEERPLPPLSKQKTAEKIVEKILSVFI